MDFVLRLQRLVAVGQFRPGDSWQSLGLTGAETLDVRLQDEIRPLSDAKLGGVAGPGWVRLNFGCPRATLDEALRRMAAGPA